MRLAIFLVLSSLCCALSSRWREENSTEEFASKIATVRVGISGKDEETFYEASTDVENVALKQDIRESTANTWYPVEAVQKSSLEWRDVDGIAYVSDKGSGSSEEKDQQVMHVSSNNASVENNISNTTANDTLRRRVQFVKERELAEKSAASSFQMTNGMAEMQSTLVKSSDASDEKQTLEDRNEEKNWQSKEDDHLAEAADFGLQAMHDLYYIHEPKLYSMGLYLGKDDPARFVAAFNDQSEEARNLARFGYAALQGTVMFLKRQGFNASQFPAALSLSRSTGRTSLERQCPRRGIPRCPLASLRYRTSDGSCNNLRNPWWGSAMSTMQRFLPAVYQDGVQSVRLARNGRTLPSARDVTHLLHENKDVPLASVTHMLMQWGQFVDHDLTATAQSRGFNGTVPQCCLRGGVAFQPSEFMHPECLPIAVHPRDNFYGPLGVRCLEFLRSGPAPKEGCEFGTREQLSQVTSYLDASTVYSSNALHSDSLRIFRNGLLQYGRIRSRTPSFSKRELDICKLGSLSTTCFRAGDGRLGEQPALTSLHVIFLRLHNRIATQLSTLNSHWSDEKIFQETRRIVGAVIQHITYREFLPIVLGPRVLKIFDLELLKKGYYEGYDPAVNPTVANAFSTAAYRFGHSLVQPTFLRFDSKHRALFNNVSIHEEFSNPANLVRAGSLDRLLLGLVNQPCQRRDEFITEEMTNHLFQTPGFAFGMDLASLNIQRGRDHGLPPYVRWREPCGLSSVKTFKDLDKTMSLNAARKFTSLYSSVEDIDLFSAGLAEKSVIGGLVGPTFACIIGQQFSNLRRGDRFWYENAESESSFTVGQLQQIRRVTLAQVLCETMDDVETIQPFVLLATDTLKNQRVPCNDPSIGRLSLEFWAEKLSQSRSNSDHTQELKPSIWTPTEDPAINPRRKIANEEDAKFIPQKPLKSSIHQNNRIIVKRPIGRPDNVTIVVQNSAVNSPVFVNEGIYGSLVKIHQQPPTKPMSNVNEGVNHYPTHGYRPQVKPIPTTFPHSMNPQTPYRPYIPHAFGDPNNPNPLAYGYRSSFPQDDVLYDDYSATSPRPTLYTYYTNFQQRLTTPIPDRPIDGYPMNYGSYGRPKPYGAQQTGTAGKPYVQNSNDNKATMHPYGETPHDTVSNSEFHANTSNLFPAYSQQPIAGGNNYGGHAKVTAKDENSEAYKEEAEGLRWKSKAKQNVTIVNELIEAVRRPVASEIPRPINNALFSKKPGQYYYEKNVLHRYPDEATTDKVSGKNRYPAIERSKTSIPEKEVNCKAAPNDNIDSASSTNITASSNRTNDWANLQEDVNPWPIPEMPEIPSDTFASANELPKPIKLANPTT